MDMPDINEFLMDIMEDEHLPPFSEDHWDALCGDIEMTQGLYNEILDLCCEYTNFAEYYEIRQSFPAFNAEYNKHFAEKCGFISVGKFGDSIEFEQFDYLLETHFRENNSITVGDGCVITFLGGAWQ